MTARQERLRYLEDKARMHAKTFRTLVHIAREFDRPDRVAMWGRLRTKAEAHADYLWNVRMTEQPRYGEAAQRVRDGWF